MLALTDDIMTTAITELRTVRDMLRWAVSCFYAAELHYGHGTDNAWDEAVALVLFALHLPPDINPQIIDAALTTLERQTIAMLIKRRVEERVPSAYLTQQAWFAGLPFYVDSRVLIPRSPIAELIEQQFAPWIAINKIERILDLCTGSGCIAIACAATFPDVAVDAVDISADALAVAKINVDRHQLQEQVQVIASDLFTELAGKQYDIIVSNPPYVTETEWTDLPKEYQHEPKLGLTAGKSGLDVVVKILQQARHYLAAHGILIVEVGGSQAALCERFPQVPFTWLEFARGGDGVFLLTAAQLQQFFK